MTGISRLSGLYLQHVPKASKNSKTLRVMVRCIIIASVLLKKTNDRKQGRQLIQW